MTKCVKGHENDIKLLYDYGCNCEHNCVQHKWVEARCQTINWCLRHV